MNIFKKNEFNDIVLYDYGALINSDCIEAMSHIEDKSIDFCCTDLPYGITQCGWDVKIPFEDMWVHLKRIVKDNGAIALFGVEPFSSRLRISNEKMYRYDWVWEKKSCTGFLDANRRPLRKHEMISVFYCKLPQYNPQKTSCAPYSKTRRGTTCVYGKTNRVGTVSDGKRFPTTIISGIGNSINASDRIHETQKPVELIEYLIKTYTNENDVVLDFTCGSATTAIAAINTNRNWVCIEKDSEIYEKSMKRINAYTGYNTSNTETVALC